jgi:hypothetical protein
MNETHSGGLIKGRTAFELLRLRYRCTTVATLRNELKGMELAIIQAARQEAERLPQPAGSSSSTSSPGGGE